MKVTTCCKRLLFLPLLWLCLLATAKPAHLIVPFADTTLEGRWDLTLSVNGKEQPSWMEVRHSGHHTLVGQFVGVGGSARPVSEVKTSGNAFQFSIPPQWEQGKGNLQLEGVRSGDRITGTITYPDGKTFPFSGMRAPALRHNGEPQWGTPIPLFNGKDLSGWKAMGPNQWVVENGVLKSPKSGSNIMTEDRFNDFKLHVEFRYPKGSNSGVYLRGRYEVQISDSKGLEPVVGELGAVYGFIAPNQQVAKDAGEWQSYDITLVGRLITVVANGKRIICEQEIPGITGGALNSNEGEPGPIYFQGDHGPVEFRNIVLTPAK